MHYSLFQTMWKIFVLFSFFISLRASPVNYQIDNYKNNEAGYVLTTNVEEFRDDWNYRVEQSKVPLLSSLIRNHTLPPMALSSTVSRYSFLLLNISITQAMTIVFFF